MAEEQQQTKKRTKNGTKENSLQKINDIKKGPLRESLCLFGLINSTILFMPPVRKQCGR